MLPLVSDGIKSLLVPTSLTSRPAQDALEWSRHLHKLDDWLRILHCFFFWEARNLSTLVTAPLQNALGFATSCGALLSRGAGPNFSEAAVNRSRPIMVLYGLSGSALLAARSLLAALASSLVQDNFVYAVELAPCLWFVQHQSWRFAVSLSVLALPFRLRFFVYTFLVVQLWCCPVFWRFADALYSMRFLAPVILDHFFVINSLSTVYGAAALYLSVIFRYILCGSVAVHAAVALESQLQASPRVATWPMVSFCVAFRDYYLGSLHVS